MRSRALSWTLAITLVVLLVEVRPRGQQATAPAPRRSAAWVLPRTADGHPDLEGVWENNGATPLERPPQLAGKPRLSDDELAALERRAQKLLGPDAEAVFGDQLYLTLLADAPPEGLGATGTYSQNWLPDRYFEHRTSLIVDPSDGRLPAVTAAGAKLRASMRRSGQTADAAQGMSLQDRCIHYGFPDLFAGYMSVYRIVQSPGQVAMTLEKIHDTRIIPLDGRPPISPAVRQYLGDSRGRWEGDTLVVETTNFHPNGNPMGGYSVLSDENLHLIERFRRTAEDTLEYTFTVDDTTMWTKPWTAVINWKRSRGELYEYACHEGNYSLRGMLSAMRAAEASGRPSR
jgi:hypothetical protein